MSIQNSGSSLLWPKVKKKNIIFYGLKFFIFFSCLGTTRGSGDSNFQLYNYIHVSVLNIIWLYFQNIYFSPYIFIFCLFWSNLHFGVYIFKKWLLASFFFNCFFFIKILTLTLCSINFLTWNHSLVS